MTEQEIIEGCKKNDRKAQEALYLKFSEKMFGVCLGYTNSKEDAQDVLQDGFVKAFGMIGQFDFQGSFEGWLRRIMVNTAIDKYRRSLHSFRLNLDLISEHNEPEDTSAFDTIDNRQFLEMIQELPEGCRIIFNLYAVEGYKHREIAEMLNISEGTSKSQVYEAKQILRRKIKRFYPASILFYATTAFKLVPR
jgi:RNA polymerase sigma-70 factor (ECF subfamily)